MPARMASTGARGAGREAPGGSGGLGAAAAAAAATLAPVGPPRINSARSVEGPGASTQSRRPGVARCCK